VNISFICYNNLKNEVFQKMSPYFELLKFYNINFEMQFEMYIELHY